MENEEKIDFFERVENFVKKNKNILLTILTLTIFIVIGVNYLNYYQKSKNEKISEKFVQAGIYLSLDKNESKNLYRNL